MKKNFRGATKIVWSDLMSSLNRGTINIPMRIKHNKKAFPNTRIEIRAINNAWRSQDYLHLIYDARNLITPVTKEIAAYNKMKLQDEVLKNFVHSVNWLKFNGFISKELSDKINLLRQRADKLVHNVLGAKKVTKKEADWYMSILNDLINSIL